MNQLNETLHRELTKPNLVISDSSEPGEGEHKIHQYIKQHKSVFQNKRNCIYGLDADLIVLSLLSGLKNIVLLRERTSFNIEQMDCDYLYLDIQALKQEIVTEFSNTSSPKQTLVQDYCFICFLLGNDFMKHSPSLILRYDGLHHLIHAYKQCLQANPKFYLINPKTKSIIHKDNFRTFLTLLAQGETDRLQDIHKIRLHQHTKYRRIYDNIQKNKHRVSQNQHNHPFPSEDIMRHSPILFMNDEKHIFHDKSTWITKYNTFSLTNSHKELSVNDCSQKITRVCEEYMKSLYWTSHYYFNQCISQEWYYPYEFAPTLYDLLRYVRTNPRTKVPPSTTPIPIKEQLEFIFPKQSYNLSDILQDSTKDEFTGFTRKYSLLKRYDWECEPIFII